MKTDKALKAVLAKQREELPYGFEFRVMRMIRHETERKQNRREKVGLVLVMLVSITLLAGLYMLMKSLLHIDLLQSFMAIRFPDWNFGTGIPGLELFMHFSMCLSLFLVMVVLLGLDSMFRSFLRKRKRH